MDRHTPMYKPELFQTVFGVVMFPIFIVGLLIFSVFILVSMLVFQVFGRSIEIEQDNLSAMTKANRQYGSQHPKTP